MSAAIATPTPVTLPLAARYFAAAVLYLLAGSVGLVWIAPDLAAGAFLAPRVAGVTHLFTLGCLTLAIFGAMSQLLPVALGAPLRSLRLGYAAFWMLAPGVGLFACGVADQSAFVSSGGAVLVSVGILLAVGNVAATVARAPTRDVTRHAIALGLAFLTSVVVMGLALVRNLHDGFMAAARVRVLAAHLHVALVGWVLIVIVGVSNRLLPMFLLSHGVDTRWSRRAVTLLALGVSTLAAGLIAQRGAAEWAGAALIEAGVGAFLWQTGAFYRARVRRRLDVGMEFARMALVALGAAAAMGPLVLVGGIAAPRLATAYVATGLLALVLYVVGYCYKIVPLLAWTARYGGRIGRGPLPMAGDLFSTPLARAQLALMTAGIVLLVSGILLGALPVVQTGALAYIAGVLLFTYQIARMRWGVPAAPRSHPLPA